MSAISDVVSRLRQTFSSGVTKPLEWRRAQLTALKAMLQEQADDFLAALHADLGKNAAEARSAEITFVTNEIDHTLAHLDTWVAPESAPTARVPAAGCGQCRAGAARGCAGHRAVELPAAARCWRRWSASLAAGNAAVAQAVRGRPGHLGR